MELITRSLTALLLHGIRSLIRVGTRVCPLAFSVLYPLYIRMTLYLNIFRKEPAITGFD
jgi:hypothetical protein